MISRGDNGPTVAWETRIGAGISGNYSAHSLRSGFASEAIGSGAPTIETMHLTGHKDIRSLAGYFRSVGEMSPALRAMVSLDSSAAAKRT